MYKKDIQQLQKKIFERYAKNKRDLPWRDSFDAYKVLVSETMLQQTQVDRVVPKFLAWMETVPDLESLAHVDKPTLLGLWSGLGFNSRAIRLQQCAQTILETYAGNVPQDREKLLGLPGVGPYTSGAILAFAYNKDVPVVDTNIRRVFIWELGLEESVSAKELENIALECLPSGQANDRYNALMDYGSLVATAKVTGIKPLSKQSKFVGSPRETRGKILKYLLQHTSESEEKLRVLFPHAAFDKILLGMVKDDILSMKGGIVRIA